MGNWTKGGWRADGQDVLAYHNGVTTRIVDDRRRGLNEADRAEARANATLIAAAPALAEALADLTERYVDLVGSGDCGFWDPEEEVFVIKARAALAAANGETPATEKNDG